VSKKPKRVDGEPPYTRYAFLNPYNLSLLIGAGAAAAVTGQWWLGVCGAAGEALWLLFAPGSKTLQRSWFDALWSEERAAAAKKQLDDKLAALGQGDRRRVYKLINQKERIHALAQDNPSLTAELMKSELDKLDALIDDFIHLAGQCARTERHLASFDIKSLNDTYRSYEAQFEAMPKGDKRRAVAKKNMTVIEQRKSRWEELKKSVQTSHGQMDLMENTFELLGDEIVSMSTPAALGSRLDDLRLGVEAAREASTEGFALDVDEAFEELEAEERRRR
jgi:hypothetical protein